LYPYPDLSKFNKLENMYTIYKLNVCNKK